MVRIVFTGGSGRAGRHAIKYLVDQGHEVLNLDLVHYPDPSVPVQTLITDLTKSGEVFNGLTAHFSFEGFEQGTTPPGPPDAVIHFAAIPSFNMVPDNACFEKNVVSTYNVVEAACKLGVKKIIVASSETTYGVCFAQGDVDFDYFPLDEEYDINPQDSYALSKVCNEKTARSFAQRFKNDIYAFRIGNVIIPEDYTSGQFAKFVNQPLTRKRNAWSYIDARDLGQLCHLAVVKSEPLGFQVFNATNDTITTTVPTAEFLRKTNPQTPIKRELEEWEAPLTNRKAREVLGFKENHNWRKYVKLN
jgi:nucleoside-diphosphate-sugar epimerase